MTTDELRAELLRFVAALCREGNGTLNDRGGIRTDGRGFVGLCELTYDEDAGGGFRPDYYPVESENGIVQAAVVDAYLATLGEGQR